MNPIIVPSFFAATAPRVASDDAGSGEGSLVYLEIQVPRAMHYAVVRHHANLMNLSEMLKGAGMPDDVIAAHVDSAMASYREALIESLASQETKQNVA